MQNDLFRNYGKYYNSELEEPIIKYEVNLSVTSYSMYFFKMNDRVSSSIRKNKNWELEIVNALNFYKKKILNQGILHSYLSYIIQLFHLNQEKKIIIY